GAATAREVAAAGWDVCLTYRTERETAEELVRSIQESGGSAWATACDTGDEADIVRVFEEAGARGPITAVVANAGITAPKSRVADMESDRVRRVLEVNVLGTLLCCREAVRRMSNRQGGSGGAIVLVSSAAGRLGAPGEYVDYAASKGAVNTLGVGLAREVADEGIRVNVVVPGLIATDIHEPGRLDALAPTVPLKRPGSAEEIAAAIAWLLSDAASYTTGAVLDVTGGR
ncbi:MAG: SDR family oxidoreductase, partial [Nocardioidaceae bacterium]